MSKPTNIPEGHRRCRKCDRTLALSAFGRDSTRPNGVRVKCRECDRTLRSQRRKRSYWTPQRFAQQQARFATIAAFIAGLPERPVASH
jgi:RNase P subunit RPR2